MQTTPQERLALGVVALLLAAGGIVRYAHTSAPPAGWSAGADSAAAAEAAGLGERVGAEVERARRRATPLAAGERIDPNTADADELQRLPRVGPALAARIVAHRETHGPFRTLADLDAVSGIGPALLQGVAPHLTLPATPADPAPTPARSPVAALAAPAPVAARAAAGAGLSPGATAPLDLNRATAEELVRLPGIGPVLAERIVEWRRLHGPFRSVGELRQVPGIGASKLEQIAPHVRVGS